MDKTLVKFVILWILCETIGTTTSIPLKDTVHEVSNTRVKRSPADNFSLFGLRLGSPVSVQNSITRAKESLSNFGNIFAPSAISSQSGYRNRDRQPTETYSVINNMKYTNNGPISTIPMPSIEDSYKSDISMSQHSNVNKVDKHFVQQEHNNKVDIKSVPEKYQLLINDKSNSKEKLIERERKDEAPENKPDNQYFEKVIDQELIDCIFQVTPDNNIDCINTTVDTTIDYTTETGEYETTTTDELLRIPPAVVATLLG